MLLLEIFVLKDGDMKEPQDELGDAETGNGAHGDGRRDMW